MKRSLRVALISCCTVLALSACRPKKTVAPPVHRVDETVTLGKVALRVVGHGFRQIYLIRDERFVYVDSLVIYAVRLRLTNKGNLWVHYQPGHNRTRISGADYPILRDGRKHDVPHMVYGDGVRPLRQVVGRRSLGPGESVEDEFYFKAPNTAVRELVLRLPAWFEAKHHVTFRFPASHQPVQSPPLVARDRPARVDSLEIRVADVRQVVPQKVKNGQLGRATKPVLAVTIGIRNLGRRSVSRTRFAVARWRPTLWADERSVPAVALGSTSERANVPTRIGGGHRITERLLFAMPQRNRHLVLQLPLTALGRRDILRFDLGTLGSTTSLGK